MLEGELVKQPRQEFLSHIQVKGSELGGREDAENKLIKDRMLRSLGTLEEGLDRAATKCQLS